jgi:hypothetical protein
MHSEITGNYWNKGVVGVAPSQCDSPRGGAARAALKLLSYSSAGAGPACGSLPRGAARRAAEPQPEMLRPPLLATTTSWWRLALLLCCCCCTLARSGSSGGGGGTEPTVIFRSNFTEPNWVAIYHIPVLLAVPLPGGHDGGAWRMMAFAEARECGSGGGTDCDPALAPDGAPKGLAFRYSDWPAPKPNATAVGATANASWVPALGSVPRFLHRDGVNGSSCCLNLGAAVFDAVKGIVHLHFVVGLRSKRGEQVLLSSRDYGTGNAICAPIL